MSKYINADKLLEKLPDDLPYKASVKRVLMQAHTADVVSKSEVDKFAEDIKLEFYREFDEIIPYIMADKIDELKKEIHGEK